MCVCCEAGGGLQQEGVLTMSDSRQDISCRTHGSRQFWFLFTFCSDVSVRIYNTGFKLSAHSSVSISSSLPIIIIIIVITNSTTFIIIITTTTTIITTRRRFPV